MILFMIYRHCLIPGHLLPTAIEDTVLYYPLMFYMAWFFFKSGMYHRDVSLQEILKKSVDRLLIPYLAFSIISLAIAGLFHGILEGFTGLISVIKEIPFYLKKEGAVICNAPLWFLLSLFLVRLLFSVLRKLKIPVVLTLLASLLSGWLIFEFKLPVGLYFGNTALGLTFFCAGFLFKEKQYRNSIFSLSVLVYTGLLVFWFFSKPLSDFHTNIHQPYLLVSLYLLAGCILINNVFKRLPGIQSRILTTIGKESMTLYVTHFIFISSFLYLNKQAWCLSGGMMALITMITLALFLPLLIKLFNRPKLQWLVGKKTPAYSLSGIKEGVIVSGVIGMMLLMVGYLFFKFSC